MAVLSNNGRLISSLPVSSTITDNDELLLQSGGVTKRVTYSTIKDSVLLGLNPYTGIVKFTNTNNKFSGSFYADGFSNFNQVLIRNGLTVSNGTSYFGTVISTDTIYSNFDGRLVGNVTGSVIGTVTGEVTGSVTGSLNGNVVGNLTGDVNGTLTGEVTSIGGTSTFTKAVVSRLTASNPILGDLRGDIYTQTGTKVLENGTGVTTSNGGIPSAYFYGTSSYASQALTAAYAAAGGSAPINGLPSGGTQYQVLLKNSGTNYDVGWVNPITASTVGVANYLAIWDGARILKNVNSFYYDTNQYVSTLPIKSTNGFYITSGQGAFTGSARCNEDIKSISTPGETKTLYGDKFGSIKLELSSSGNVTMSLKTGQTCTIFIESNGSGNTVSAWSGISDVGATSIYWKNGSVPTVSSGAGKKDVFTFVNISSKIFASAVQNFS